MNLLNQLDKGRKIRKKVRQQAGPWIILLGIIFITVNLRAPLTSVGPLVELIRNSTYFKYIGWDDYHTSLASFCIFLSFCSETGRKVWR